MDIRSQNVDKSSHVVPSSYLYKWNECRIYDLSSSHNWNVQ